SRQTEELAKSNGARALAEAIHLRARPARGDKAHPTTDGSGGRTDGSDQTIGGSTPTTSSPWFAANAERTSKNASGGCRRLRRFAMPPAVRFWKPILRSLRAF